MGTSESFTVTYEEMAGLEWGCGVGGDPLVGSEAIRPIPRTGSNSPTKQFLCNNITDMYALQKAGSVIDFHDFVTKSIK